MMNLICGWESKLINKIKKMRQGDTSLEVSTRRELYQTGTKIPKCLPNTQKPGQLNWAPDCFPGETESSQALH